VVDIPWNIPPISLSWASSMSKGLKRISLAKKIVSEKSIDKRRIFD
jgi:hypothetical protein